MLFKEVYLEALYVLGIFFQLDLCAFFRVFSHVSSMQVYLESVKRDIVLVAILRVARFNLRIFWYTFKDFF